MRSGKDEQINFRISPEYSLKFNALIEYYKIKLRKDDVAVCHNSGIFKRVTRKRILECFINNIIRELNKEKDKDWNKLYRELRKSLKSKE